MSLSMRPRPAALSEQAGAEHVVTVKNTFLEVARTPCRHLAGEGLRTAPAALHAQGALLRSLLSAVGDADCRGARGADGASTPTTVDTPVDSEPSTPSSACEAPSGVLLWPPTPGDSVWPPTPASPRARKVTITLDGGLVSDSAPAPAADAFFSAHAPWMPQHGAGWACDDPAQWGEWAMESLENGYEQADAYGWAQDAGEATPSAPAAPPSFPPDFFKSASEPEPPSSQADGDVFPCVPNAPAPKCAPPPYAPQAISGLCLPVSAGTDWVAVGA